MFYAVFKVEPGQKNRQETASGQQPRVTEEFQTHTTLFLCTYTQSLPVQSLVASVYPESLTLLADKTLPNTQQIGTLQKGQCFLNNTPFCPKTLIALRMKRKEAVLSQTVVFAHCVCQPVVSCLRSTMLAWKCDMFVWSLQTWCKIYWKCLNVQPDQHTFLEALWEMLWFFGDVNMNVLA